jgi:hypothetical protein
MKSLLVTLFVVTLTTSALAQNDDMNIRKPGKFGITVKGGPAFPVGEFGDMFKVGFTGFIDVPYNLSKVFQVYLGVGYSSFNVDNGKLAIKIAEQGKTGTTNIEAPYHVVPVVLGINYSYQYQSFVSYLTICLGMYYQTLEPSGTATIDGVTTTITPKTEKWAQGAYAIGIGGLIPIGDEGWAVDVNAKFNSVVDYDKHVLILTGGGNDISTRAIRYISALVGLSYTFR